MGRQLALGVLLVLLVFLIPWLRAEPGKPSPPSPALEEETPPAGDSPAAEPAPEPSTLLRVKLGDGVQLMDLEEYLVGVVRAEMPAAFHEEALKAQAVAARTYTLHKMENGGSPRHPEADACDDVTCCKAYLSREAAAEKWGENAQAWEARIRQAVEDTRDLCVLYEGQPILAVFHSSCPGATQDAAQVWSGSLPYLQPVESPESEDTVPGYHSLASFTPEALRDAVLAALPEADLSGDPSTWFTGIRQARGGMVESLRVGGVEVKGSRLRTILGLRSACFTIRFQEGKILFAVTGYGHGVGMSQYGANVLAENGKSFREILTWYYTGASVEPYVLRR